MDRGNVDRKDFLCGCCLTLNVEPARPLPITIFTEEGPPHASHIDTNHLFPISTSYEDESIAQDLLRQWTRKC